MIQRPSLIEANLDAIVGPTHHFGGLGVGNVASQAHAQDPSSPKAAALQGLEKAALVSRLGIPQYLLPPPMRPDWQLLCDSGFAGTRSEILADALAQAPVIFSAAFSSAFMWAANSATVAPACDTTDGKLHLTLANLTSSWHRAGEAAHRMGDFRGLLGKLQDAEIHSTLPMIFPMRDEGAANHMRLCSPAAPELGVHIFVDGDQESALHLATSDGATEAHSWHGRQHLPRHTRAASEALIRSLRLNRDRTFLWTQHGRALDRGVFHNDVIATSHQHLLLHHEFAFAAPSDALAALEERCRQLWSHPLNRIMATEAELPLDDAVASYLFNSQILSPAGTQASSDFGNGLVILCPSQCETNQAAKRFVDKLVNDEHCPIQQAYFLPLEQSMAGGGGPACLRLRLPVSPDQLNALDSRFQATDERLDRLRRAIEDYYPERITLADLQSVDFIEDVKQATQRVHACFTP